MTLSPRLVRRAILAGFLVSALTPEAVAQGQKKAARPNVLFIAIDDLNDWTGCLGGHPQAKTPNLDGLAKKGVLFTRAYCAAPACNPSRAALLAGKRPSSTGVYFNEQDWRPPLQGVVTLPHYFLQNGYLVWGGGKIFHGGFPDTAAWTEYFKGKSEVPKKELPPNGIGGNMAWGPLKVGDEAMPDTHVTDWAIGKLKQKHDQPFFLAVGYVKPHLSWHVPQKYFDMHPLDQIQLPKVQESDLNDVPPAGIRMARPEGDHKKIVEKGVWKEAVQAYLAAGTYMDTQLGRLLEALEASGHADNTIIILWTDHGWHLGEKEHWRKFALWEEATRVVLTAVAPGVTQPAGRCERTVNLLDLYPTLVELCDLPQKKGLEGNSLMPLLRDPSAKWDHASVTTHGRNNHGVRTERWRYIRYADGSEELYDHTNDPLEWTNLAKRSEFAGVKEELARHLPTVNAPDAPKEKAQAKGNKKGKNKKAQQDDEASLPLPERTPAVRRTPAVSAAPAAATRQRAATD